MASSKSSKSNSTAQTRKHTRTQRTPAEVTAQAERQMLSWVRSNYSLVLSGLSQEQNRFAQLRAFAQWQGVISAQNSFGNLLGTLGYLPEIAQSIGQANATRNDAPQVQQAMTATAGG